jgi:hypothetical protein
VDAEARGNVIMLIRELCTYTNVESIFKKSPTKIPEEPCIEREERERRERERESVCVRERERREREKRETGRKLLVATAGVSAHVHKRPRSRVGHARTSMLERI